MKARIMNLIKFLFVLVSILGILACTEDDFINENEPDLSYEIFIDKRDGQNYKYIQIGNQIWMAENLNYDTSSSWIYDNKSSNAIIYGRLYNWETACNVCPDGWHLPSKDEMDTLINYLGGPIVAGGKMKRTGTTYWNYPNTGATNSSGFTALSGGIRYASEGGWFDCLGEFGGFWISSEYNIEKTAFYLSLHYSSENAGSYFNINGLDWCRKDYGHSVRCIKD